MTAEDFRFDKVMESMGDSLLGWGNLYIFNL